MKKKIIAIAGLAGLVVALAAPAVAQQEFGSPELIAAAKKEGKLVYYTANFAEVEQQVIKAFNKRFPEISVEMVRAPGGQLITRVKTEAAAGKLIADVVDHSDRALMLPLVDMFQDYAPPNAADYNPDAQISPKLWPRATLVWSIAYNTELVKKPKDLLEYVVVQRNGCNFSVGYFLCCDTLSYKTKIPPATGKIRKRKPIGVGAFRKFQAIGTTATRKNGNGNAGIACTDEPAFYF